MNQQSTNDYLGAKAAGYDSGSAAAYAAQQEHQRNQQESLRQLTASLTATHSNTATPFTPATSYGSSTAARAPMTPTSAFQILLTMLKLGFVAVLVLAIFPLMFIIFGGGLPVVGKAVAQEQVKLRSEFLRTSPPDWLLKIANPDAYKRVEAQRAAAHSATAKQVKHSSTRANAQ